MKKIEVGATNLRTRDGRHVRIYAVDGPDTSDSIHGAIRNKSGWVSFNWYKDGRMGSLETCDSDIMLEDEPKPKLVLWREKREGVFSVVVLEPEGYEMPKHFERVDLRDLVGWDK